MFAVMFSSVLLALLLVLRCTSCRRTRDNLTVGRPVDPFGGHRFR